MTKGSQRQLNNIIAVLCRITGTGVIICTVLLLGILTIPRLFGYQMFNVVSGSMEPEISKGSLIFVENTDPLMLKEGDIIAFNRSENVVCHRVVDNNTFSAILTTKGDANEIEDPDTVNYADLIGIVKSHVPSLGGVGAYISTFSGKLLCVELLVVGIIFHLIAERIKS